MPTLFQAGTISGLLQGVYDGTLSYSTLSQHGDIGLGTFNGVDGEMIAVDGVFYHMNAQGHATVAHPDALTPFAVVTKSKPSIVFALNNVNNLNKLNSELDKFLPTKNIFYMIQIDGKFESINLRSEECQPRPYQPLAESLLKTQKSFELTQTDGTLVTTFCPQYSSSVTISGYHHHFIDLDRKIGGHVFDLKLIAGKVLITPIRRFSMSLIESVEFDTANLEIDVEASLKKTE